MERFEFFARRNGEEWQPLEEHLGGVARLAAQFCAHFGAEPWGRLAGLWHDIGKYQPDFQRRLAGEALRVEHSGAGAALAMEQARMGGTLLAFVIAGHHAGLANQRVHGEGEGRPLESRVAGAAFSLATVRRFAPPELLAEPMPSLPAAAQKRPGKQDGDAARRMALWIRFLFSALVDADRLDSEAFGDPERAAARMAVPISMADLAQRLDAHIDAFTVGLSPEERALPVNAARAALLSHCRAAAHQAPGLFSLTVPTGGGKTLSGMSFALRHAAEQGLRRVIVVLPFTSIIEQNAAVYRNALGAAQVLEHHANLSPEKRREILGDDITTRHELAEENWDAPVIVTTTIQFFETLFANKTSRCRKLHSIAQSVIVLDEVQTLPIRLLSMILAGLRELTATFGCSIVLSTATPPALTKRQSLDKGLPEPHPIVPDPERYFRDLKRVHYHWPDRSESPKTWNELAREIARHPSVLVIVDRRADARTLAEAVQACCDAPVFHLSALMCPAHRLAKIAEIREMLRAGKPCRVISTQLVEAGVDLDFPIVYRALAGLPSIVQAAGRCNREGRLNAGEVHIFVPESFPRVPEMKQARDCTELLLNQLESAIDPDDPAIFERYFRQLYGGASLDQAQLLVEEGSFNFGNVGARFRMIEEQGMQPIVVPWGDGPKHFAKFQEARTGGWLHRDHYRALQPFTVQVYNQTFEAMRRAGMLDTFDEEFAGLGPGFKNRYSEQFGLDSSADGVAHAAELIT